MLIAMGCELIKKSIRPYRCCRSAEVVSILYLRVKVYNYESHYVRSIHIYKDENFF